ncbi:MAG TPA: prepilin-type N-terminal cleavage/methylation domain-containing protein [Desulfobacterales bacterium]|nr:prepilin-type N-terminal cleavage/methylation domain-containing protein [Desulfobacterales bacterium]HIP39623.1 prepilin-type N-terminal cleavage/methylation domain-containing protein [Desulfocapsa sulfexigens]
MLRNENAFTLIETLMATVVLGIGIVGLWAMQITAVDSNSKSYFDTTAIFDGTEQIEIWMGRKYKHSDLVDTDGNGTNQDSNWDGLDDVQIGGENPLLSGNYGLNNYPGCSQVNQTLVPGCTDQAADHTLTAPDGTIIYWNVAMDYPVEYTKTIRIHMIRPMAGNNPITFEYIKEEGI